MPITTMGTDPDLYDCRKPHERRDSGELAVFEATRYFSGEAEETCNHVSSLKRFAVYSRDVREGCSAVDGNLNAKGTGQPQLQKQEKKRGNEKKAKYPKSPGSKLIASLWNSLFSVAAGKKMVKVSRMVSAKESDESPCGGRRRRSSIGHLQSVSDNSAKAWEGSNYERCLWKENRCNPDDDLITACLRKGINHEKAYIRSGGETAREKGGQEMKWSEIQRPWEKRPIRKTNAEEEDGFMSDSSSDLFELQNCDIGRDFSNRPNPCL
ncbi:unnamed protein product [Victoria cruziana]